MFLQTCRAVPKNSTEKIPAMIHWTQNYLESFTFCVKFFVLQGIRHDCFIQEGYSLLVITFRLCFVGQRYSAPYEYSRPHGWLSGKDSYLPLLPLKVETLGWVLHLINRIFSCFPFGNSSVRGGREREAGSNRTCHHPSWGVPYSSSADSWQLHHFIRWPVCCTSPSTVPPISLLPIIK